MAQSTSTSGNQPLIELKHVDKHYGDLHVLNDINLSVDRGEVVVVIGPSGSGWAWCFSSSTCSHI